MSYFIQKSKLCAEEDPQLGLDEACLRVKSSLSEAVTVWAQSTECEKCDLIKAAFVPANDNVSLLLNSTYPYDFYFHSDSVICNKSYNFGEHGIYLLNITEDSCSELEIIRSPDSIYIPLIISVFVYLSFLILWNVGKCICSSEWIAQIRARNVPFSELESDLGSPSPTDGPPLVRAEVIPVEKSRRRVKSLDVFRGISISIMIFVNYGGGRYWFFKHSPWNGLTFADLVFPWFLWIMGASMAISLRSQLRSSLSRKRLFLRVFRRFIMLMVIGLILNTAGCKNNDVANLRLPGVLQRIGTAYFVVATIETILMKPQGSFQYGRWLIIQDILDSWIQWLIILVLTAAHTLLTFMLPVPGCPMGYLGPGGLHNHSYSVNCTGGAAGYIDQLIYGKQHIYQRPTCKHIYRTNTPYDPEGALGTLTSILMVYLGVQAGRIILCYHYTLSRILRWTVWAVVVGLIAGILCDFSKNDGIIPVNKNLWSLSFVLALASMAFILQSALYFIVDAKRWWSGSPFVYAGMNSIVIYIGHEVTKHMFPWSWQPYYHTHEEFLVMNLWGTTIWLFIAYALYKKNVFITL